MFDTIRFAMIFTTFQMIGNFVLYKIMTSEKVLKKTSKKLYRLSMEMINDLAEEES